MGDRDFGWNWSVSKGFSRSQDNLKMWSPDPKYFHIHFHISFQEAVLLITSTQ